MRWALCDRGDVGALASDFTPRRNKHGSCKRGGRNVSVARCRSHIIRVDSAARRRRAAASTRRRRRAAATTRSSCRRVFARRCSLTASGRRVISRCERMATSSSACSTSGERRAASSRSATRTTTAARMSPSAFGEGGVHGVVLAGDSTLYVSTASEVLRYRLERLAHAKAKARHTDRRSRHATDSRRTVSRSTAAAISSSTSAPHRTRARRTSAPSTPGRDPCPELGDERRHLELSAPTDDTQTAQRRNAHRDRLAQRRRARGEPARHDGLCRLARARRTPRLLAQSLQRRGERDGRGEEMIRIATTRTPISAGHTAITII